MVEVASLVIEALERVGVRYSVGGSIASSFSGEPRASIDVDIVVDMAATHVDPFVRALGPAFYADPEALRRAVLHRTTNNVIHLASGIKINLFVVRSRLDERQLERRRPVQVSHDPARRWFVHSPEDIRLQKLLWYREGGGVSDRQWRDILAILIVQDARLDENYLQSIAAEIDVRPLLDRARAEARGERC